MLFNSLGYLIFLAVGLLACLLTPRRYRVYPMGLLSLLFYGMWRWEFIFIIMFQAAVDFLASLAIHRTEVKWQRRTILIVSLSINIALLVFFKYVYFFYQNLSWFTGWFGIILPPESSWPFKIILPLGISFYTFESMSYTIDVYRRLTAPTRNYFVYLTFVCFWPHLIAGPILRAGEIISQLVSPKAVRPEDFTYGLQRILSGLFKKVVIADTLAGIVDTFFAADPGQYFAGDVWLMAFFFGFQIYFDFAGYSDIAIGSARMLGITFAENFNWPYLALSPREFWQRWNITLSSWIRDYLYLPLTGLPFGAKSRAAGGIDITVGEGRRTYALFLSWFIMGLWHGAGWTFAVWGLYHATIILLYRKIGFLQALPRRLPIASWALTLLMSMAGWIAFRAQSLEQMLELLLKIINPLSYWHMLPFKREIPGMYYLLGGFLLVSMVLAYRLRDLEPQSKTVKALYQAVTMAGYALMVAAVIIYLRPLQQFIYFQF